MRRRSLRHLVLLAGLLSYLLAGFGTADAMVWCIGSEGTSRLEHVPQGGCGPIDDRCVAGEESGPRGNLTPDHCGDCLDLPALSGDSRPSPRFADDGGFAVPPVFLPALPSFTLLRLAAVPGFRPQPPPQLRPVLLALRTVILRN